MPVKSRKRLYEEIEHALFELKRQDVASATTAKPVITCMDDLKRHVREEYGQGVMGFAANSLQTGVFNLASGSAVKYHAVNILYEFEVLAKPVGQAFAATSVPSHVVQGHVPTENFFADGSPKDNFGTSPVHDRKRNGSAEGRKGMHRASTSPLPPVEQSPTTKQEPKSSSATASPTDKVKAAVQKVKAGTSPGNASGGTSPSPPKKEKEASKSDKESSSPGPPKPRYQKEAVMTGK